MFPHMRYPSHNGDGGPWGTLCRGSGVDYTETHEIARGDLANVRVRAHSPPCEREQGDSLSIGPMPRYLRATTAGNPDSRFRAVLLVDRRESFWKAAEAARNGTLISVGRSIALHDPRSLISDAGDWN